MKLLRRATGRSEHIDILIFVEDLGPWPAKHGTLALQFARGKRTGQTKPAWPNDPTAPIATYKFGDTLKIPATLFYNSNGGFEDKMMSLFVAQVNQKGKELAILGGLELNLADFAGVQGRMKQSFPVECSSAIWGPAGGRPQLTITVAVSRNRRESGELAASMSETSNSIGNPSPLSSIQGDSRQSSRALLNSADHSRTITLESLAEEDMAEITSGLNLPSPRGTSGSFNSRQQPPRRSPTPSPVKQAGIAAAGLTAAAVATPASSRGNKSTAYDSDGFIIDSDLTKQSGSRSQSQSAALTANRPSSADQSASTSTVKRNLKWDMEEATSAARPASPGMASSLGTRGGSAGAGGGQTPQSNGGMGVSKGSGGLSIAINDPSPSLDNSLPASPDADMDPTGTKPTHARRFSRGEGSALGSRRWAWRRQSSDPMGLDTSPSSPAASNGVDIAGRAMVPPLAVPSALAGSPPDALLHTAFRAADTSALSGAAVVYGGGTPEYANGTIGRTNGGTPATVEDAAAMERELQVAAALEAAVFLAGRGWGSSWNHRQPKIEEFQAPARRLARTIIILGPEEGVAFGRRAVAAVRAAASASLGDPHRLLLWWANAMTLRWSFWALARGGVGSSPQYNSDVSSPGGGQSNFEWLSDALGPMLRQLESQMYNDLVNLLWTGTLLPTAALSAAEAAGAGGRVGGKGEASPSLMRRISATSTRGSPIPEALKPDASAEERAVAHWIRGLRAVDAVLSSVGRPHAAPRPLLSLLRRQALAGVLGYLDRGLLDALLTDGNAAAAGGGRSGSIGETLPPELIPFQRGKFSFSVGVQLKMAAGRLVNWAADAGVREGSASMPGTPRSNPDKAKMLPQLREVADLLMLPKGSFGDEEMRRTVAPSLAPGVMVKILQRYQPDNGAADKFSPSLIKQLRAEEATDNGGMVFANGSPMKAQVYVPPSEEVLLQEGLVQPLSLDMSADSDEELSALEERGDRRYTMLRHLWGAGRTM